MLGATAITDPRLMMGVSVIACARAKQVPRGLSSPA
jgi:hypothetical protein